MADFTPYLACSRASTGYAQTVAGQLTSFAANTLRRTDKGLLIEEARTNYCPNSQDVDNVGWIKTNVTVTANATTAPDGTTTADTLTDDSTNGLHEAYRDAVIAGANFTLSAYLKAGTHTWVQLGHSGASTGDMYANFNLVTGTIGNKHANITARIEALAGGWYRCSAMGAQSSYYYVMIIMLGADVAVFRPTYVGTGTTVHVWGAQVEAGDYPTSYIPTTSVAVTRAADAITFIGSAEAIFDGAAASAVASMDVTPKTAQIGIVRSGNEVPLYKAAATSVANSSAAGSGALTKSGLASGVTTAGKYGSAWARAGGRSVTGQGLAVATDASVLVPGATIYLGSSDGSADAIDGYIKRLTLWDTRISDTDLEEATADDVASAPSLDFSDQANSQYLPLL